MKTPRLTRRTFLRTSILALAAPQFFRFPLFGEFAPGNRLDIALIGCGNQGSGTLLKQLLATGQNVVALCDVDETATARTLAGGGDAMRGTKVYADYRRLLDREKSLEAVVIATPDHWHAALCTASIKAGRHVYCEKPLTRTIAEARELGKLAASAPSVTQMGNHGSAFTGLRRSVELIRAGVLGQVREIHVVAPAERFPTGVNRPAGEDPIPAGLNWDFWIGPSPLRPYKAETYHPYRWRGWLDFGTGQIGNWACHSLNLPIRALDLGYPDRIEINGRGTGFETYWKSGTITYHFPAKGDRNSLSVHWHENQPLPESFSELVPGAASGVMILGEKGVVFTDPHNGKARIKLEGEPRLTDVNFHEPTKSIPTTLSRTANHMSEWTNACKGGPKPYSDFVTAAKMTETVLPGLLAVQMGRSIPYDGAKMEVPGEPAAAKWINPAARTAWL